MPEPPLTRHTATPQELQERIAAERRGDPFLVWRDAAGKQYLLSLDSEREGITVGRREANDIALEWDDEVSRLHAHLERMAGEWTVADEGLSANGSYVNGERIVGRRRLRDGDALRFGSTVLVYRAPEARRVSSTKLIDEIALAARLSDAQRRVLIALARPFGAGTRFVRPATNQDIAAQLFLSVDAVKTHLRRLYEVFGLESLPQNEKRLRLAERAFELGLVAADTDATLDGSRGA